MMCRRLRRVFCLGVGVAMAVNGWCTEATPPAYRLIATEAGIPPELFYAVALAESGTPIAATLRPWPWTLNVAGQGRFYPSRTTAWTDLQRTLATGERSIDIGVMQVNWRYHQTALQDPWRALDPYFNLRVAATILMTCHAQHPDWWHAVGCYHAPHAVERATRYSDRVRAHWRRVIGAR